MAKNASQMLRLRLLRYLPRLTVTVFAERYLHIATLA